MGSRIRQGGLALLTWAAIGSAWAVKVPVQDDFAGANPNGNGIRRDLWFETEQGRFVEARQLRLGRFIFGGTSGDTGSLPETFSEPLLDSTPPKSMGGTITVADITADETCAANPFVTNARARLIAAYFNQRPGGPVPGDRTGDVLAQIRIGRAVNSPLPTGEVEVQGILSICNTADCGSSTLLGVANFASVTLGTPVVGRVDWSKKAKTFDFTANGVTQSFGYSGSHAIPPVLAFVQPSLRNEAANCLSTAKVKTGIVADFDNLRFSY